VWVPSPLRLHATLPIGHRGGLVIAQRFPEQINRLFARAVLNVSTNSSKMSSVREGHFSIFSSNVVDKTPSRAEVASLIAGSEEKSNLAYPR
jgi:hypothetical protein